MVRLIKISLTITMMLGALMQRSASAQPSRPSQSPEFGSFEPPVSRCVIDQDGTIQTCSRVQLTQRSGAALRIRFFGAADKAGTSARVTFIANHPQGETALACKDGRCQPSATPWSASVISGSTTQFDERGLPDMLPEALPMHGTCRISDALISCAAQARNGITLSAEARI